MRLAAAAMVGAAGALIAAAVAADAAQRPCTALTCDADVANATCFHDHNTARLLPDANFTSPMLTRESCAAFCYFTLSNATAAAATTTTVYYAGVEDGDQCFCSRAAPNPSDAAPLQDCNKPCAGNSSQACGAASRVNAFAVRQCSQRPIALPYCNTSLPLEARRADLLSRMTTAEKIACLDSSNCSLTRFGVQQEWREALHGLRCVRARALACVCVRSHHARPSLATIEAHPSSLSSHAAVLLPRYPCVTDVAGYPDPLCATR